MLNNHTICIGAQRTSTTRLFECLRSHPQVSLSEDKEVHYFNAVAPIRRSVCYYKPYFPLRVLLSQVLNFSERFAKTTHGARALRRKVLRGRSVPEYYYSKFDGTLEASCDITPAYSLLRTEGIRLIQETVPKAKILFIIRDPVERMWSEICYFNRKKIGQNYIENISNLKYIESQLTEHHRKRGAYYETYSEFKSFFVDFKVVTYEELNLAPEFVMKEICDFMEIDSNDSLISKMPLHSTFNAINKAIMPEPIKRRLVEFHLQNYEKNHAYFGDQVKTWVNCPLSVN